MNNKITVFTPTYNRSKLLWRVFDYLQAQTVKQFIWMVIDDGSEDDTSTIIKEMEKTASFPIEYYYQPNGGKHRAHNTAVKKCNTDYFLILDSDDYLAPATIEILLDKIAIIDNDNTISGIIGNRFDKDTNHVIGTPMPNIMYASSNELYQKYGLIGDTLRMYKTNILKQYLFPEINGEKFVSENVVFDKIDLNFKMLAIKEMLYFCDYQEQGYSCNIYKIHNNSPIGYAISLKSSVESAVTIKKKVSYLLLYKLWCKKKQMKCQLEKKYEIMLSLFLSPFMYLFLIIKYPIFFFKHFKN